MSCPQIRAQLFDSIVLLALMLGFESESVIPGSDILCFNRTAGKQIRVLSNNLDNMNSGKENTVNESNRLTSKIVKLFD
uniref:Uncharacterized protein n=1 Tax=Caenorhabditis japonica TaxID=281687 RepID=A0A8R1EB79_CAEJA